MKSRQVFLVFAAVIVPTVLLAGVAFAALVAADYNALVSSTEIRAERRASDVKASIGNAIEDLLRRETARPMEHYQPYSYFAGPDPQKATIFTINVTPSPLASEEDRLVAGYFMIDVGANIITPYFVSEEEQALIKGLPGAQNLEKSTDPAVVSRHRDFAGSIEALFKPEITDIKVKFESLKLDISRAGAQEEIIEILKDPSKIANLPPDKIDPKIVDDVNKIIEAIYFDIAGIRDVALDDRRQTEIQDPSGKKAKTTQPTPRGKYYPFVPVLKTNDSGTRLFFIRLIKYYNASALQGFELTVENLPYGDSLAADAESAIAASKDGAILVDGAVTHGMVAAPFKVDNLKKRFWVAYPRPSLGEVWSLRYAIYGSVLAGLVLVVTATLLVWLRFAREQARLLATKSDFVSAVTHELKTPLTSIRMYSEMLSAGYGKTAEKTKDYAGRILSETERLSRLVTDVLDLARVERKSGPGELIAADLSPIVRHIAENYRPVIEGKGFELDTEIADDGSLTVIKLSPDGVERIVLNLIDNALKYGRPKEGTAAVKPRLVVGVRKEKTGVIFLVADNGPGVPPADREAIFEKFQRRNTEVEKRTRGVGVGLAMVSELARAMEAKVAVRPTDPITGEGATFTVTFPV